MLLDKIMAPTINKANLEFQIFLSGILRWLSGVAF